MQQRNLLLAIGCIALFSLYTFSQQGQPTNTQQTPPCPVCVSTPCVNTNEIEKFPTKERDEQPTTPDTSASEEEVYSNLPYAGCRPDSCSDQCAKEVIARFKKVSGFQFPWSGCRESPRKMYLGFTWNNEWDILEIQVETSKGLVEKVIILESNVTFAGKAKPVLFRDHAWKRYDQEYRNLVVPHFIKYTQEEINKKGFVLEHKSRNMLVEKMKDLGASPHDLAYIGDVDQVLRPELLWIYKWSDLIPNLPAHIGQTQFAQSFTWKFTGERYLHSFILTLEDFEAYAKSNVYEMKIPTQSQIPQAVWHLTWFLQPAEWISKLRDYSHFDWNRPELETIDHVMECKKTGMDPYKRKFDNGPYFQSNPLADVPPFVLANRARFNYMIFPPEQ